MYVRIKKEVSRLEDICNFLPKKNRSGSIEYYHFVYETNFKRLSQPFFFSRYGAYLVFKGCGILKTKSNEYNINSGTLFFTFPQSAFEINSSENLTYLYITFDGNGAKALLDSFSISEDNFVFPGMEQLTDFWMTSIRRITPANATALTESVLLYSLSFIGNSEEMVQSASKFESILRYINENFSDPTLSVKKIADVYFYSEKYLSSLFVKKTGSKFTEYLNKLRITHAITLLKENSRSVSQTAFACGFSDPMYFSKVFKKIVGISPSEYVKSKKLP